MKRIVVAAVTTMAALLGASSVSAASGPGTPMEPAVVSPPSIAASFSAGSIPLGASTLLRFTITNPNAIDITGVQFYTQLPTGLHVLNGSAPMCGGLLETVAATREVNFSEGIVAAGGTCQVSVGMTGAAQGNQAVTTNEVGSNEAGFGNTVSASVYVFDGPTIQASFSPAGVAVGETSTVTITIANAPANQIAMTPVTFSGTLPAGLHVIGGISSTCHGDLSLIYPHAISFTGGWIGPLASCSWPVAVTAEAIGSYDVSFSATACGYSWTGNSATAHLNVTAPAAATPTPGHAVTAAPPPAEASAGVSAEASVEASVGQSSQASGSNSASLPIVWPSAGPSAGSSTVPASGPVAPSDSGPGLPLILLPVGALAMLLLVAFVFWLGRKSAVARAAPAAEEPVEAGPDADS